jgi:hypothetical protein
MQPTLGWALLHKGTMHAGNAQYAELTDEAARRLLRYALGSRMTKTHDKLIGALGTLHENDICTAVELLIQIAEHGEGSLWEIQLTELLQPVLPSQSCFQSCWIVFFRKELFSSTAGGGVVTSSVFCFVQRETKVSFWSPGIR